MNQCLKTTLLSVMLLCVLDSVAQDFKHSRFPIWTYHEDSVQIHGVGLGLLQTKSTSGVNGIRIELIGGGVFLGLLPESPIARSQEEYDEKLEGITATINGLNLSAAGLAGNYEVNGMNFGVMGHYTEVTRGISAAFFMNMAQLHSGLQFSMINDSYKMNGIQVGVANGSVESRGVQIGLGNGAHRMRGLQIGLLNYSKSLKGLQIGLWNVNEKRKLPIVNW